MRVITIRRADVCIGCGAALAAGDRAGWDQATKSITCLACLGIGDADIERGQAGASAARAYQRGAERHRRVEQQRVAVDRAWRSEVKAKHPILGSVASAVTPKAHVRPEPQHVKAWATGAPGEVRVGQVLDSIEGIVAVHDRRIPHTRANIDHLAITPAAIWVIDSKRYVNAKVEFRNAGGIFRPDERLIVGGRDRTKLVDAMAWQVEAVNKVLDGRLDDVAVKPALCFVDSTWNWLAKPFLVRGVAICWPKGLPDLMSRPGPLDWVAIEQLARGIAAALPPA